MGALKTTDRADNSRMGTRTFYTTAGPPIFSPLSKHLHIVKPPGARKNKPIGGSTRIKRKNAARRVEIESIPERREAPPRKNEELLELYVKSSDEKEKGVLEAELVGDNQGLVWKIAKRYYFSTMRPVEVEDFVCAGNEGLLTAIRKYDPDKAAEKGATKFSTYATWWIKQKILKFIRDNAGMIKVPNYIHDQLSPIRKMEKEIRQKGKEPTFEELMKRTGLSKQELSRALAARAIVGVISLDMSIEKGEKDGTKLHEVIASKQPNPEVKAMAVDLHQKIFEIIASCTWLGERTRKILEARARGKLDGAENCTLDAIGKEWGVGRERIRQIIRDVLRKGLAKKLEEKGIRGWNEIFGMRNGKDAVGELKDAPAGLKKPHYQNLTVLSLYDKPHPDTEQVLERVENWDFCKDNLPLKARLTQRIKGMTYNQIAGNRNSAENERNALRQPLYLLSEQASEEGIGLEEVIRHNKMARKVQAKARSAEPKSQAF